MLTCNTPATGTFHYGCKKEQWIAAILPHCEYQHITLTMPDTLWPAFKYNSDLVTSYLFVAIALYSNRQKNVALLSVYFMFYTHFIVNLTGMCIGTYQLLVMGWMKIINGYPQKR